MTDSLLADDVPTAVRQAPQKAQLDRPGWVICFVLVLLAMYFQVGLDFNPSAMETTVRWGHVIYPLVALLMLGDIRKMRWLSPPMLYFITASIFTAIAYLRYGFNLRVYIFLYAGTVYFLGTAFARRLRYETVTKMLRRFLLIYLCVVLARDVIWIGMLGQMDLYALPQAEENTFIVGGLNAEGQIIAISSALLLKNYLFPCLAVMAIAAIYSSRSTFLLWGIATIIAFFGMLRRRGGKISLRPFFLAGLVVAVLLLVLPSLDVTLFKRFSGLGGTNDSSTTRIMLFVSSAILILRNPFGYGFGNAVPMLFNMWSGIGVLRRDTATVENFVFQMALDTGVITLCIYFYMIIKVVALYRRHRKFGDFFILMLLFWISNLAGGGGGNEPIFWIVCGMFFTYCEALPRGSVAELPGSHAQRLHNGPKSAFPT